MLGARWSAIVLSVLLAGGFGPGTASGKEAPERPIAVQVNPLSIPVAKPNNVGNTEFITVYLVVNKKSHVENACYWIPRIRDALMQTFYQSPMAWDHFTKLHLGAEDARLYRTVQYALNDKGLVARVHAAPSVLTSAKSLIALKNTPIIKCKVEKAEKDKKKH